MAKQHFNERFKMGRLKKTALQLTALSRPVTAQPVNLASRSTDLLVRNGQRANDSPPSGRDECPSLIDKMMHCYFSSPTQIATAQESLLAHRLRTKPAQKVGTRRPEKLERRRSRQLIPSPIDQNSCAHWRNPMDMMRQG